MRGYECLTFNVLLHAKSEQKVIANKFCTPIIFKISLKTVFSLRNILIIICVGCVWIAIYISYSKEMFNRLSKVIGTQNSYMFLSICLVEIEHFFDYL